MVARVKPIYLVFGYTQTFKLVATARFAKNFRGIPRPEVKKCESLTKYLLDTYIEQVARNKKQ